MTGKLINFGAKIANKFSRLNPIYKQLPVIVGVPVVIKNSKGEILLAKRNKNMYAYPNYWNLPGGLMQYGEQPRDTAKREAEEEVGAKIKIIKQLKNIYNSLPNKQSGFQSIGIPFEGKILSGKPYPKDETQEIGWFSPKQIKKMKLAYTHKDILKKEGFLK